MEDLLLAWFAEHGRDLPWRRTRDPYAILVSEVMLQQTQVARVVPRYLEWLERWPTAAALAAASRAEVLGGDLLEVARDRGAAADALRRARPVRRAVLEPLGVVGEVGEPGRDVAGRQRAAEAGEVEARRRGAGCGVGRGRGRSIGARVRRTR